MNIRLKAAIYTVGLITAIGAGAFTVLALASFGGIDPNLIFAILLIAFGIWTMYELMLSKLKFDDEIDAISKRIEERMK